jgi:gamma-glutamyltranspeptidase / glutathione hydrolase
MDARISTDSIGPWSLRKPALIASGGVVASQSLRAAKVGAAILAAGGNAVDAAIATGLALAAAEPWMSGLGGVGFMVVQPAEGTPAQVVAFGAVSPRRLDPARYAPLPGAERDQALFGWPRVADDRNVIGPESIAVPGEVEGLRLAHERFGSLPWPALVEGAIALAEEGVLLDWYGTLAIAIGAPELALFEPTRRLFLPGGLPPVPGVGTVPRYLPLPALARTLRRLASAGPRDFYEGEIARGLASELKAAGSVIDAEDLQHYRAEILPALEFDYRGQRLAVAPGLTAGPALQQVLARLADRPLAQKAPSPGDYLLYARSLRQVYAERLAEAGAGLEPPGTGEVSRASSTSHLSVVDRRGMVVALTQTLLSRFGSKVLLPDSGVLMNNGMMWFDPRPSRANSIAPAKRPLSNMCPVTVRREGRPWLALGASGGRGILPAVTQILSFLVDFGMDLEAAFHQPRLDESGAGVFTLDRRMDPASVAAVAAEGPIVLGEPRPYPVLFASPCAVLRERDRHIGMAEIASPWSGALAEGA